MTDKDQQLREFRAAVARKAEAADEGAQQEHGGTPPRDEEPPAGTDGAAAPRQTSTRKDGVTADKWNQ